MGGRVAGIPAGGGYRAVAGGGRNYGARFDGRYNNRYPNYGHYYGGRYPYYGRYYGRYPYYGSYPGYGWGAAGLVTGAAIGAAAASTYPTYATPVGTGAGGYCATSVRTCALVNPAPVGTGCSCRTNSGRARGSVVAQ
jgi:hypothetical protein